MTIFSKLTVANMLTRKAWNKSKALILRPDRRKRPDRKASELLIWECELPHKINLSVWVPSHADLRATDWEWIDAA
jgi:hypothetical protein